MPPDSNLTAVAAHDPSSLLEHVGWVRELAQRLVRDPHAADDLTQETMLAAIENRGEPTRSPRAWLGRVLRNVLWERVRQTRRREAREARAAETTPAASSADLVERVDTHRNVVDAVMKLPEHYRTVLLRRYFEGETPTQIAAKLDVPISTVKTRLQRGIERMRGELDDSYGSRDRWQPALVALAGLPQRAAVVPVALAIAAALLLTIGVGWAWSTFANPEAPRVPATAHDTALANPSDDVAAEPVRTPAISTPPQHDDTAVDWGAIKMPSQPVRGQAVTPEGQGVGGMLLRFDRDRHSREKGSGTKIVLTEPSGKFEMQANRSGRIVAVADDHATLCAGIVSLGTSRELLVVVAPARHLTGSVRDENGGLEHAEITLEEPTGMRAVLGPNASSATSVAYRQTTSKSGAFAFEQAPFGDGMALRVRREGYADRVVQWQGEATLDITMQRLPAGANDITGFVLAANGTPVSDARVSCGTIVTRSDHAGAFRLGAPTVPDDRTSITLVAIAPGYGAGLLACTEIDEQRRPHWPVGAELRLTTAPLTITGRVLRANGEPCRGARVWLADPTLFAHEEGRAARTSVRAYNPDLESHLWPETVEALQTGGSILSPSVTDAEGHFHLEGLCDRSYQLVAYDYATSQRSPATAVRAGDAIAEVKLRDSTIAKVRGIVVDQDDNPVPGISVSLEATLLRLMWGSEQVFAQLHMRGAMRTGPDGSFWLFDVPREGVMVHFRGSTISAHAVQPTAEELRVVVHRTNVLNVHCTDSQAIDSIGVVDQQGEAIAVLRRRGNSEYRSLRIPVHEGKAEAFALPDHAWAIVGYRDDREVRRTQAQRNLRTITW